MLCDNQNKNELAYGRTIKSLQLSLILDQFKKERNFIFATWKVKVQLPNIVKFNAGETNARSHAFSKNLNKSEHYLHL